MAVGVVIGLVLWVRGEQRRSSDAKRPGGKEAPFDAEAAASRQAKNLGGPGSI
jgi:hypothetical protein